MQPAAALKPNTSLAPTRRQRFRRAAAGLSAALVISLAWLTFRPVNPNALRTAEQPAAGYAEAVQRLDALRGPGGDEAALQPECRLRFLDHGQKQPRAVVLVHGYTACPQQFAALGQEFYALGYNVLIAPLPQHGLANPLTDEQTQLTAEALAGHASELVDIARGLGDHVTMLGLSGGGVVTAWAAQQRADLDVALLVSPGLGYRAIQTALTVPVMNAAMLLPNQYEWWDPNLQAEAAPGYGYPRYATWALAQILRLGQAVFAAADRQPPAAGRIVVVTNANDNVVNNELVNRLAAVWRASRANLQTYEFPADLGLDHDLISPEQPRQRTDLVYPKLIELAAP